MREIYRTAGVEMNREDLQEMGRAIYKIWEEANERSWEYIYKEEMTEMEKYNRGISYYREISDGTK